MFQPVKRGRVWEIEVGTWPHGTIVVRTFLRPHGAVRAWLGRDKRLAFLADAPSFADVDAFLALLGACLNPGQRAWLTRWLAEDGWAN